MRSRFFLAVLIVIAAGSAARAENVNRCIDRCFSSFTASTDSHGFNELRKLCLDDCDKARGPVLQYGAIAFGPTSGAWGYAVRMGNQGQADNAAMQVCRAQGDGCRVVASYADSCAAVEAIKAKSRFTVGRGRTADEAKANALQSCQSQLGKGCVLWTYTCAADQK